MGGKGVGGEIKMAGWVNCEYKEHKYMSPGRSGPDGHSDIYEVL